MTSIQGIPLVKPLYHTSAVHYRDALVAIAIVPAPRESAIPMPPPLQAATGGMAAVLFADYPESSIGPYREVLVLVPVTLDAPPAGVPEAGWFCPLIYVTTDTALAQGRELWGFPKKMATIEIATGEMTPEGTRAVQASCTRNDELLCSIDGSVSEPVDVTAISALLNLPIFNHKIIWAADGSRPDIDQVTMAQLEGALTRAHSGTGTLHANGEVATCIGEGTETSMLVGSGDFILPAGRVVS